jgi:hypothetical protein
MAHVHRVVRLRRYHFQRFRGGRGSGFRSTSSTGTVSVQWRSLPHAKRTAFELGATRWLITTIGYGYETSALPVSVRPYVELQQNRVRGERGDIDPRDLYGSRNFWGLSAGARIYLGGGPMRMGSYGALDPMTAGMRPRASDKAPQHDAHAGH